MAQLPAGTVTFLFSDIEGSTRLWEADPDGMKSALVRHDEVTARAVGQHGGYVFKHTGDGFCASFTTAEAALSAAVDTQLALRRETRPSQPQIRVRIGIHTGQADPAGDDYFGPPVNRAARVMSCAHGGQIICTAATREVLSAGRAHPGADLELHYLGIHRLRDLGEPQRLYQVVHPDLEEHFPPLRTLDAYRNNLPTPRTSFVGRAGELTELVAALGGQRLVTVTGVGGSGKTRLALQAAAELVGGRPDGVFFVELASLSDPSGIMAQIADTIGLSAPGVAPGRAVEQFFGSRHSLLVLDNCEHLLDASAVLCDALLSTSQDLSILATSREPLGVPGEVVVRIPSLGLADDPESPSAVSQSEAGQLFIDRARAVQPQFGITADNAAAVADICRRLDGIPLAIELAAARVRHIAPQQIAERLNDRFRLLTGGARTSLPRQQTLKAALDWSFELLTEEERRLLLRLSVFVGTFPLRAVEAVCSDDGGDSGMDGAVVLDVLAHLVDRSLVVAAPGSGEAEYRLLETVRHYAQERLVAAGEATRMRDRHRSWYAEMARRSFPPKASFLIGGDLAAEHYDNLMTALQWAVTTASAIDAMVLAGQLCGSWLATWKYREAEDWLTTLLSAPWVPDCAERSYLASLHASFAALNGDFALSLQRAEVALQYAATHGHHEVLPVIMWSKAIAISVVRSIDEAVDLLDEAARLALELGQENFASGTLCAAATYRLSYDVDRAMADAERAANLPGVDDEGRITALMVLAVARVLAGDTAGAAATLGPSLLRHDPTGDTVVPGVTRGSGESELLVPYAVVLAATGDLTRAKAVVAAGRQRLADVVIPLVETAYLVASGASEIYGGDPALGMHLLGAARRCFGEEGAWRSPVVGCVYVQACRRAREVLGEEAVREARLAGMALDREQAAAMAE